MNGEHPVDRILALAAIPALRDLDADDLLSLAERAVDRRCPRGVPCTEPGECSALFVVSGSVEVESSQRVVAAPALLGAIEAAAGVALSARGGDAETHVLAVDRESLDLVMADVFEVRLAILRHAGERLLALDTRLAEPAARAPRALDSPAPLATRIELLSACEILRGLRIHALGRLAAGAEEVELSAGAPLWEQGAAPSALWVVASGRVSARGSDDHCKFVTDAPGAVIGVRELLAGQPRATRVEAATAVRALRLPAEVLIDELEDDPDMAGALLAHLAAEIVRSERVGREEVE
jgi:Cyclic nucleotide-binding domain